LATGSSESYEEWEENRRPLQRQLCKAAKERLGKTSSLSQVVGASSTAASSSQERHVVAPVPPFNALAGPGLPFSVAKSLFESKGQKSLPAANQR
jgi:hypothetical protein